MMENKSILKFTIQKEESGWRLDKFLISKLSISAPKNGGETSRPPTSVEGIGPSLSRSKIQKMIKGGSVKINGKTSRSSYATKINDEVEIILEKGVELKIEPHAHLKVPVIFEDENYLIINKPAGMVVYPAEGHPEQDTVVNWLVAKIPEIKNVGDPSRPGVVHRLDRETGGVMIIAKTNEAWENLTKQFLKRTVAKTYLAWVRGIVKEERGSISKPIRRGKGFKLITAKEGRGSLTNFEVVTRKKDATLLKIIPLTGRMHQIRVHLASIGHPVIGDTLYGRDKRGPMMLCAQKIEFRDLHGNLRAFEAGLPQYFNK
jgi:23S rRNA pseudouridine1911/1915/1917 synthase